MKKRVLHLILISRWYDMQLSGEKTEEYRERTPYWDSRLLYDTRILTYTHVCFHRGYSNVTFEHRIESISVGFGKEEWGAPKDRQVYIIKHCPC